MEIKKEAQVGEAESFPYGGQKMRLGNYKGLRAKRPQTAVADAEVEKVFKKKQREFSVVYTVDGRPAQIGDQAVIDFDAECDGKPVRGGRTRSYPLLLGGHSFVKGFEEAVVGHVPGDRFDIIVTFPENYRIPMYRGKRLNYHVKLLAIRHPEYQPLDDDFARDFSEYETLKDWRAEVRAELEERREASEYEKMSRGLLEQIIATSKIPVDRDLKRELAEELYEDWLYDLEDDGMTPEKYFRRTGKTKKDVRAEKEREAVLMIQQQSVLHAIANKEGLVVTEEELAAEICALAEEEGEDPDVFREMLGDEEMESIIDQLTMDLAMRFVIDHAVLE